MTDLLTIDEVARRLQVSERQVQRLIAEGLPYVPVGRRAKRVRSDALETWLKGRERWQSGKIEKAAGTSRFATKADAFTAAARKVRLRKKLGSSKRRFDVISGSAGSDASQSPSSPSASSSTSTT